MAINGINGPTFNPYANATGVTRSSDVATRSPSAQRPANDGPSTIQKSVADAIKHDASSRSAQVASSEPPDGVDRDLWSVLTKEERSFFVKAGTMGPLTYGRFSAAQSPTPAPMLRGGRLDIKA
jgi:hypothetical protein